MRRHTLVLALVALLSVTGLASAQTAFPPELDGDGVVQGETGLKFVPTEHYNLPWSIPGPDPETAWLTDIGVQVVWPFDLRVEVECLLLNDECWLVPNSPIGNYPWVADIGSYCNLSGDGTHYSIDCYTFKDNVWSHYVGALEYTGSPPQFYDWSWFILDVANGVASRVPYDQLAPLATE